MFPISDDNPTLRTPIITYGVLAALLAVWFLSQGAGFDALMMAQSVCEFGMIPAELTGALSRRATIPVTEGELCILSAGGNNWITPVTSMFLHGGWMHLIGNGLYLWVFGNNVEDSMGRFRFLLFYLLCGLAAAGAHVLVDPSSRIPTIGASGAISGVLGGYLVLYPRVRVNMLFIIVIFIKVIPLPAWMVLIWWFGTQLLAGLPQLSTLNPDITEGVAYWAHIGGFVAGVVLVKLFENPAFKHERDRVRHVLHPYHP